MDRRRLHYTWLLTALLLACTGGQSGNEGALSDPPSERDGGPRDSDAGPLGDDGGVCGRSTTMQVGWDEQTELGTPSEIFGALAGSCTATLRWDGSGFSEAVEPLTGESEVTVTVELDQASVVLVDTGRCSAWLSVGAQIAIETADGRFADMGKAEIIFERESGLGHLRLEVDADELGGTLGIDIGDATKASLLYELDGANPDACSGEVRLSSTRSSGRLGIQSSGTLASWSASDCPLGTEPVELAVDAPVVAAVEELWRETAYPGEWDDGISTQFVLQVELLRVSSTCSDAFDATTLPARVTYSTSDGRIESHTVEGVELRVTLEDDGTPRSMELWLDETLRCVSEGDSLPYTLASCASLESVQIQLGIQWRSDGSISFSDLGLNAYERDRDSTEPEGAADRVRLLTLSGD